MFGIDGATPSRRRKTEGEGIRLSRHIPRRCATANGAVEGQVIAMKQAVALLALVTLGPNAYSAEQARSPVLEVETGHVWTIKALALSPDGRLALSGGEDHATILWDVATGTQLSRILHQHEVSGVAFSPDGALGATANAAECLVFRVTTLEVVRRLLDVPTDASLAFSPDGHSLLIAGKWDAQIWDLATDATDAKAHHLTAELGDTGGLAQVSAVAISPDGKFIVTGDQAGATLWDAKTAHKLRRFAEHPAGVNAVAFSPDGTLVLTGSGNATGLGVSLEGLLARGTAVLWDVASGREVRRFPVGGGRPTWRPAGDEPLAFAVMSVGFSLDGRRALTGSVHEGRTESGTKRMLGVVQVWDMQSGAEAGRFEDFRWDAPAVLSPDGESVLAASYDHRLVLQGVSTGRVIRTMEGRASPVWRASAAAGILLVVSGHDEAALWDLAKGGEARRLATHTSEASGSAAALSADGAIAVTGDACKNPYEAAATGRGFHCSLHVWRTSDGKEVRRIDVPGDGVIDAAVSRDGGLVVSASKTLDRDDKAWLWALPSGNSVGSTPSGVAVALSPDGGTLATGTSAGPVGLWNLATGTLLRSLEGHEGYIASITFSPDGTQILTTSGDGTARLWEPATGKELRRFAVVEHPSRNPFMDQVWSGAFSPDGHHIVTGRSDGEVKFWETGGVTKVQELVAHSWGVPSVAFLDAHHVMSASWDGTVRIWEHPSGRALCALISLHDGTWVVIDSEGRFDTNNVESIRGLHWRMPDDPVTTTWPLELFMRDYYEPRLLPRLLAGEKLRPVPPLQGRNRAQPEVRIGDVKPEPGGSLAVRVEVAAASVEVTRDGQNVRDESGPYDVRLFRNGRLVGYDPRPDGEVKLEPKTRKAALDFSGIRIPDATESVEFSAYAFNKDRVKSLTDRKMAARPPVRKDRGARAYVIAMGVNAYESPEWNLRFAANDARGILSAVTDRLRALGVYEEVVPVGLISDRTADGRWVERSATKAALKSVISLLAGHAVDVQPKVAALIPELARIRPARPDDLVLIFFAGHGYADVAGSFYLVPQDVGAGSRRIVTTDLLRRCISSDELSLWLRDVDAGEVTLIIDACYSAAAIEGGEFKPGPMGSRGLGQLAYDKGMRILAATQADDVALEDQALGHGLLTYALVREGLEQGRVDLKSADGAVSLAEWLAFAVERVPGLYQEIATGQRALVHDVGGAASPPRVLKPQRPALFDFSRTLRSPFALTPERRAEALNGPWPAAALVVDDWWGGVSIYTPYQRLAAAAARANEQHETLAPDAIEAAAKPTFDVIVTPTLPDDISDTDVPNVLTRPGVRSILTAQEVRSILNAQGVRSIEDVIVATPNGPIHPTSKIEVPRRSTAVSNEFGASVLAKGLIASFPLSALVKGNVIHVILDREGPIIEFNGFAVDENGDLKLVKDLPIPLTADLLGRLN